MIDAAPAQVREVQQAVNSTEIHKSSVLGNILHVPVHNLAFGQRFHQRGALGVQLFFEQCPPADHHVAAAAVQLGDANLELLAEEIVEVLRGAQSELRTGEQRTHAALPYQ